MADSLAFGNVAIEFFPARENPGQRTFAQKVTSNFAQWLARVEDIAIRIDAREHSGEALEVAEAQQRLDRARRSIDGLDILFAPVRDFTHQLEVARIFDQAQIGQLFLKRALRREYKTLLAGPIENAFDLADIPFFDHRADRDRSWTGHAGFCEGDILHHLWQCRRFREWIGRIHGQGVQADHQAGKILEKARTAVEQSPVGDEHDRTKTQALAGRRDEFLDIGAQSRLAAGEHNGVRLAANHAQQAQRFACGELLAKDVRFFLSAITAGQIALVRRVENESVGRDDLASQDFAAIKIREIEPKGLQGEWSLID